MDANEIIKMTPRLQSIATTIVAGVPLAEIVKRIVLPSADVLGKRMADRVERCFGKTAKMIEDAGITPQPVPDKIVVEILQGASLEDNEDLHTMWAALLANAAGPGHDYVLPSFAQVLKELTGHEAMLLNTFYNQHRAFLRNTKEAEFVVSKTALFNIYNEDMPSPGTVDTFNVAVADFQRMGVLGTKLIAIRPVPGGGMYPDFEPKPTQGEYGYYLTEYGLRLVAACSPPEPKP